jgi:hypothetical protein
MIAEKSSVLKIKLNKKELSIIKFYRDFVEGLYALFCFMLDDPVENFWYESISISLGYFQILIYIIDESVSQKIIK